MLCFAIFSRVGRYPVRGGTMEVRCAVIGIGTMGKKYAGMIGAGKIKGLTLTAVVCRSESNAVWAKENLPPSTAVYASEDGLYEHPETFDAVIIVTPHKSHPPIAIRALNAGKHVMCDKPAGVTVADALSINEAASNSDRVYAMMCHQRTYACYRKIKELLDECSLGHINRVMLENSGFFRTEFYHKSGEWRSSWNGEGGGALINQGYHLLDMWQYLFGLPQSVYADIPFGKYNGFAVDDEATVIFDYPEKVTGTFVISTGEGSPTERLEIVGTKGRILLDGNKLTLTHFDCDTREYSKNAQVTSGQELNISEKQFVFEEEDRAYEIMLENFADAVLYGKEPIACGADSVKTLSLINAAYLSAWKGKKICLPMDNDEYVSALHEREKSELNG